MASVELILDELLGLTRKIETCLQSGDWEGVASCDGERRVLLEKLSDLEEQVSPMFPELRQQVVDADRSVTVLVGKLREETMASLGHMLVDKRISGAYGNQRN